MTANDSLLRTITHDHTVDTAIATEPASAAQRQRAYRQRSKRAVIDAIGNEAAASRTTLVALLAHELAILEQRTTSANMIGPARHVARRVLNEIITRYEIEL